jgi:hypothetical protein
VDEPDFRCDRTDQLCRLPSGSSIGAGTSLAKFEFGAGASSATASTGILINVSKDKAGIAASIESVRSKTDIMWLASSNVWFRLAGGTGWAPHESAAVRGYRI